WSSWCSACKGDSIFILTSTSSACLPTDDCRPWTIEIHAGLSEADGGPGQARLADGLCPAGGHAPGTLSGLRAAPRVHGRHPAWGCSSQQTSRGARRMRTAGFGRPVRDAVCLVAARGRGITACVPCLGAVTVPGIPIALSYGGLGGPVPGRM